MGKNHKIHKKKNSKAQKKRILRKVQKRDHKRTYDQRKKYKKRKENKVLCKGVVCFIFSIFFLVFAIAVYFDFMGDKTSKKQVQPAPFVALACNKPNQEMEIFSCTDEEGMTDLSLRWEQDSKYSPEKFSEVTFWIMIFDQFEFSWSCQGDVTAMDFIDSGGVNDRATPLHETSGKGRRMLFEFKCRRNQNGYVDVIKIQNDKAAFKYVENDMCKLRVPWICPWVSATGVFKDYIEDESSYFNKRYDNDLASDDLGIINRNINREVLYQPLFDYKVSVADQSYFDSNLELNKALEDATSADPVRAGVYCYWSGGMFFIPRIEYTVLDYDSKMAYKANWCFALFGIGLSLFWEAIKGRVSPVKIIRRDVKSKH